MRKRLARVSVLWVGLVALAAASLQCAAEVVLYLAPGGRDTWSGGLPAPNRGLTDGPLASLAGARDRLRALRVAGRLRSGARVVIRGGVYRLREPLILDSRDSGEPGAPVVFEAAPGHAPVVTGGRVLSGWRRAGNRWVTRVGAGRAGPRAFRQLFVNGRRRQRARSPNSGFYLVDGPIENVWRWGAGGAREDRKPSTFLYRGRDILPSWAVRGDVEVVALQVWAEARMRVVSVDPRARRVTLSGTCCPSNREDNARYWVENAPECLDAPGEWYLDAKTGLLQYIPLPGERLGEVTVTAPALTELVRLEGDPSSGAPVHDITFRGITFREADWSLPAEGYVDVQAAFDMPAAVTAVRATRCRLERCTVRSVGGWGIELGRGCHACALSRCTVTDVGAGGIKVGDYALPAGEQDAASGNTVEDCRVRDIGIVFPAAVGIWIGQAHGILVSHSEVSHTWQSGISVGWSWGDAPSMAYGNTIEYCSVHDIGRGMLSDMGGIYTLGRQPGTTIRGNVVRDVRSRRGGSWGIYLDEGSSGIRVENNLVYRTTSAGFMLHYGHDNTVTNNVFALSDEPNVLRCTEDERLSFTFERNIVLARGGIVLDGRWSNGRFVIDRNVYWSATRQPLSFAGSSFAAWQARGHDVGSLVANPQFIDPNGGDFRLRPGSPAFAVGFRPVDWRSVGPRRQAAPLVSRVSRRNSRARR